MQTSNLAGDAWAVSPAVVTPVIDPNLTAASPAASSFHPTAERIEQEIQGAMSREVTPYFASWVDRYAQVGKRNPYLWRWCRHAVEVTTLPCVPRKDREHLGDLKTLGVMWDVLLDDLADQNGNQDLLEQLLLLPQRHRPDLNDFSLEEQQYGALACDIWDTIQHELRRYPRYEQYCDLLRFDYLQLCGVMRYSHLLNRNPGLLNLVEHDLYTPHNMHIMICSTFDLIASPDFSPRELGELRQVIWNAQFMGRIGNLVTTWERELNEGDYTSGVYARAVACGHLTLEDLATGDRERIRAAIKNGGHEAHYLERWQQHRRFMLSRVERIRSFDVRELVAGYERLICLHLGSRGKK